MTSRCSSSRSTGQPTTARSSPRPAWWPTGSQPDLPDRFLILDFSTPGVEGPGTCRCRVPRRDRSTRSAGPLVSDFCGSVLRAAGPRLKDWLQRRFLKVEMAAQVRRQVIESLDE